MEALLSDPVFVVDVEGDELDDEDESLEPVEDGAGVLFSDVDEESDLSDFADFSDFSDFPRVAFAASPDALSAFPPRRVLRVVGDGSRCPELDGGDDELADSGRRTGTCPDRSENRIFEAVAAGVALVFKEASATYSSTSPLSSPA